MDDKTKGELKDMIINVFNQGFEELVLPALENLEKELTKKIDNLSDRLDSIDRKLDRTLAKQYEQQTSITDHEKRIKKIETHKTVN